MSSQAPCRQLLRVTAPCAQLLLSFGFGSIALMKDSTASWVVGHATDKGRKINKEQTRAPFRDDPDDNDDDDHDDDNDDEDGCTYGACAEEVAEEDPLSEDPEEPLSDRPED